MSRPGIAPRCDEPRLPYGEGVFRRADALVGGEEPVPDRVDERTQARLRRDGGELLAWEVGGLRILGPERLAGLSPRGREFLRGMAREFTRRPEGLLADTNALPVPPGGP